MVKESATYLRAPKISFRCALRVKIWDEYHIDGKDKTEENRYIFAQEFSWVVGYNLPNMCLYSTHAVCLVTC